MDRGQSEKSPLDQLEAQVNLVLEHTGRLFANSARNHGPINNPMRLKQVITGATNSFHDALDELEGELTLARAVMRRDLAIYRAKRETRKKTPPKENVISYGAPNSPNETNGVSADIKDEDIIMSEHAEEQKPSPSKDQDSTIISDDQDGTPEQTDPKPESSLQLDIPGHEHQAPGHPTDVTTGTYSNFDFESLFNDPSSAGGASRESPKPEISEPEPKPITSAPKHEKSAEDPTPKAKPESYNAENNDFDFEDLTTFGDDTDMQDTDGISSLLPGLESYANSGEANDPQPSEQPDFNIFDAAGANDFVNEPQKPAPDSDQQQQSQGAPNTETENRDTTFDDIMNFTEFDMGDFGGGENESEEHKFDASFFDI